MTDRLKGVWVIFDKDIREDDAQPIIDAIKQIRHVLSVKPSIADGSDYMARERVRMELSEKLWDVLHPEKSSE